MMFPTNYSKGYKAIVAQQFGEAKKKRKIILTPTILKQS